MKTKIIQEFLNSGIKIKSKEKLEQYVQFCIENNQYEHTKFETEYHHILPKAKSLPFEHLNDKIYNGTFLTLDKHYTAHKLLFESIEHYAVVTSFNLMEKRCQKNQVSKEERSKLQSLYLNEIIKVDGKYMTRAMSKGKNISKGILARSDKAKEIQIKKRMKKMNYSEVGKKHSKTINDKEWKCNIGISQIEKRKKTYKLNNIQETANKKQSKTKQSKEWKETKEKIRCKKYSETMRKKHTFHLHNINSKYYAIMSKKEVRELSPSLFNTTKEKYLGHSKTSLSRLKSNNNEFMRGCYLIEV